MMTVRGMSVEFRGESVLTIHHRIGRRREGEIKMGLGVVVNAMMLVVVTHACSKGEARMETER